MIFVHEMLRGPDRVRLLLSGEIDLSVREDLRSALQAAVAASAGVIDVDLRRVVFLDCTGIGELVRAYHHARDGGRTLVVTRPQGIVRRVLELTSVLPLLTPDPAAMVSGRG